MNNHKQPSLFISHGTIYEVFKSNQLNFLPLVFASTFGGHPTKIHEAFQWKNLSMSAFKFD